MMMLAHLRKAIRNNWNQAANQPPDEEAEDRARLLLTRRRFLFLGAAAAGSAILRLRTPEYVIGQWADYYSDKQTLAHLTKTYYTMPFLENLKQQAALTEICAAHLLPEPTGNLVRLYTCMPADLQDGVPV